MRGEIFYFFQAGRVECHEENYQLFRISMIVILMAEFEKWSDRGIDIKKKGPLYNSIIGFLSEFRVKSALFIKGLEE